MPTVESLLADKMTAFAPRTTGVPFVPANDQPADTMQIVKQLFDVGELFNLAEDLNAVRRVYGQVFVLENGYRGGDMTLTGALDDTLQAALCLSLHRLKGVSESADALMLEKGVGQLRSHLVNHRFNLDVAKIAAAKAALLSRLVTREDANHSLSFWRKPPELEELKTLSIGGDWERLNRIKATVPEAFHYWHQTSLLLL